LMSVDNITTLVDDVPVVLYYHRFCCTLLDMMPYDT
jgi:hypothetical protein